MQNYYSCVPVQVKKIVLVVLTVFYLLGILIHGAGAPEIAHANALSRTSQTARMGSSTESKRFVFKCFMGLMTGAFLTVAGAGVTAYVARIPKVAHIVAESTIYAFQKTGLRSEALEIAWRAFLSSPKRIALFAAMGALAVEIFMNNIGGNLLTLCMDMIIVPLVNYWAYLLFPDEDSDDATGTNGRDNLRFDDPKTSKQSSLPSLSASDLAMAPDQLCSAFTGSGYDKNSDTCMNNTSSLTANVDPFDSSDISSNILPTNSLVSQGISTDESGLDNGLFNAG